MIAKKRLFVVIVLSFLITIAGFYKYFSSLNHSLENRVYPQTIVNQVDFGKKTKEEVKLFFDLKNKKLANVIMSVYYNHEPVATISGQQINLHYDSVGLAERAYLIGRSTNFYSRLYQQFSSLFSQQKFYIDSNLEYEKSVIRDVTTDLEEQNNKPAKNALFKFENSRVVSFRQEESGLSIESDKFIENVDKQIMVLKTKIENKQISVESKIIEPEITLAKVNTFGIEELIGEGKSDYTHSIPERVHNIILASSKFNGVLIPKDKIFSFNDTVGDISALTGYKPAYIIKNGRTVLGDGGGVCQVSTTFFRAALNTGLPIIERSAHAYRVGYYENDSKPGFDATVFAPTNDLKIKNDTPAYILIQTEVDKENNLLYFRFYGKKDSRKTEISKVILYDISAPPPPIYQDDPTLKKGVVKQTDFPAWGGKANFHYRVEKDGQTLIDQDFFSNFRPWQAVYLVGTAD